MNHWLGRAKISHAAVTSLSLMGLQKAVCSSTFTWYVPHHLGKTRPRASSPTARQQQSTCSASYWVYFPASPQSLKPANHILPWDPGYLSLSRYYRACSLWPLLPSVPKCSFCVAPCDPECPLPPGLLVYVANKLLLISCVPSQASYLVIWEP